jgi:flagellar basal-body rod protein FlgB
MLDRLLNTDTFFAAQGALDGLSARHAAIADNIANVNTPGYKRKEVRFEDALSRALSDRDNPCGTSSASRPFTPCVSRDTDSAARADGNNVDVEAEMVSLAETSLRYETLAQYVGGYFSGLKAVINAK